MKRPRLNRETLRCLSLHQLSRAVGGTEVSYGESADCPLVPEIPDAPLPVEPFPRSGNVRCALSGDHGCGR